MNCHNFQIVLQEVPGEISLCFSISGCSLHCEGCHSPFLWKKGSGTKLDHNIYAGLLHKYHGFASCVLFMGGEWHEQELIQKLKYARRKGYKTCLYTGEEEVVPKIGEQLTWLKTGRWIKPLGGLDQKRTNQRFIEVKTKKQLNHLFIKT
ncbi:anaerobic ribonucleoside-triphosphate reductase activating protein [Maribacter sp. 2304DJ31-5]|uniref:anaerobic ribonucleoside-triphosphate reductase activating protein n=1 Tax=Maribacter sp. 2304DJ31-5 TaxID=3386273 RepID=UPI0039BC754A